MRLLAAVLAVLVLTGCSHDFWYRPPRVAGQVQAPCPEPCPPPVAATPSCPPVEMPAPSCPSPCPPPGPAGMPSATPPPVRQPAPVQAYAGGQASCDEQAVLDEVNRIRTNIGLQPFRFSPTLHVVAEAHSREQCTYGYMGHSSPDPRRQTLLQRMQQGGYDGRVFGEVVAWGYQTPQSVVEGWMNSRDHRAILVDRDMQEAAFSRVGDYWTGNFATPSRPPSPPPASAGNGHLPEAAPPRVTYAPAPPSQAMEPRPVPVPRPAPRSWRPPLRGG